MALARKSLEPEQLLVLMLADDFAQSAESSSKSSSGNWRRGGETLAALHGGSVAGST